MSFVKFLSDGCRTRELGQTLLRCEGARTENRRCSELFEAVGIQESGAGRSDATVSAATSSGKECATRIANRTYDGAPRRSRPLPVHGLHPLTEEDDGEALHQEVPGRLAVEAGQIDAEQLA